jgi:hypothetical protein
VTPEGADDPLLGPLAPSFEAFQWHSYEFPLPPGAIPLAKSEVGLQACRLGERAWAIQFHPEVSRADALHWINDYDADPDAVRLGIDPAVLGSETEEKIATFTELGRNLCRDWLLTGNRGSLDPHFELNKGERGTPSGAPPRAPGSRCP